MNQTELTKVKRIVKDHRLYSKNFLKIKTKAGTLEPLIFNEAQETLNQIWKELEQQGKPVRILVLKARRLGISTYVQAKGFHFASSQKYRHVKIVSHEVESTETLFEMSKLFYDVLPETIALSDNTTVQIKPKSKYSNRRELVFDDLKSQITLKTAGKDTDEKNASGVGRSQTVHFLHCSEVDFWPAAKNTLVSLLQTVPNLPGTVVILETTANGIGGYVYKLVQQIQNGESDYVLVFLPWHIFKEYRIPLEPGETLEPYDEEELSLIERFKATPEQLKWRRQTIRNECQGDVDQFHQEYPSDIQEAFLTTGRPFFNRKALVKIRDKHQREPIERGYLEWLDPGNKLNGGVKFIDDPKGYISIWADPKPLGCYCIGGDVAEGLEKGDYSDLDVLDRDTFEQAAQWHGHIDPDLFGEEAVKLAIYYNRCWLGAEINNHGISTNKAIAKLRYPRMYMRKVLDEKQVDPTDKLGWRTDIQSRPLMLDEMEKAIRDGNLIVHSEETISECLTFVRNDTGKPEAQADCYDDRVIGMAICIQMHKMCPMSRPEYREENTFKPRTRRSSNNSDVRSEVTNY
jgi:hypothetical protein